MTEIKDIIGRKFYRQFRKMGPSTVLTIPYELAQALHLKYGQYVRIYAENERKIVVEVMEE